jgi:hypothetical protein
MIEGLNNDGTIAKLFRISVSKLIAHQMLNSSSDRIR